LTACSELHPTGKGLSYFYLYWKKNNFHRPININLSLDKKICLLHSTSQMTPPVLCLLARSFITSEEHLKGSLFHLFAPQEQTFHLSFHLVRFQGNAGTNMYSHALTDEHTQAGVRNMK